MSREAAVLATLVLYKCALIAIGLYCRRRTHDVDDFYLGGRRLGPLVASLSASASSSSAWTLLGVSGAAYAWGVSALWLLPGCVGGFVLNWYLLAPRLQRWSRQCGAVTVTDLLAGGAAPGWKRRLSGASSAIILLSLGVYVASQFQGAGKTLAGTFGLPLETSILAGAAIVVAYTLLGGFWAVSVTDTLQGSLMATAAILLPLAGLAAVGGPFELAERLGHAGADAYLDPAGGMGWFSAAGFVLGLLGIGLGYPGQPHVVNRFMALADRPGAVRDARRLAVAWALIVYSGMLLLGFCGRVLAPGLTDPELVFIRLSNELFPPAVSGIVLAAVLSAIMSTVDSQLLVASSTVSHDLGLGAGLRWSPLARSRVVVLALSAGAVVAALVGPQEIFSRVLFAWAAMGCAFGPLLLILSLGRQVPPSRRLWSIGAGFVLSVAAYYLIPDGHPWKGSWERVIPFLAAALVALSPRLRSGAHPGV